MTKTTQEDGLLLVPFLLFIIKLLHEHTRKYIPSINIIPKKNIFTSFYFYIFRLCTFFLFFFFFTFRRSMP